MHLSNMKTQATEVRLICTLGRGLHDFLLFMHFYDMSVCTQMTVPMDLIKVRKGHFKTYQHHQ